MKETNNTENALQERLLGEYRQAVSAMLESSDFSMIKNSSPKHAAILIEEMVGHAEHSFCAVAQRMNPMVWSPRVIDALAKAMSRGVAISLLIVASGELEHLKGIPDDVRNRIHRAADPKEINLNLAIMDAKAVRFEYDIAQDKAVFCVNETELASLAQAKFDTLYKKGSAI